MMASDETMATLQDEELEDDGLFDDDHQHPHPHNLSRLSVCTSGTMCGLDEDDMSMYVSHLSIESFEGDDADADADADGELSEEGSLSSESEVGSCYSLPATPPRRRGRRRKNNGVGFEGAKEYASDNEAQKRRRRSSVKRVFGANEKKKKKEEEEEEEEEAAVVGGAGVVLITRPKGGKRTLCMGLEEVKACRDLGFELEHQRMLPSLSNSTPTSSSGANSPISNWRISSPGDDPRDVKARLKVWAHAVALASASSKYST